MCRRYRRPTSSAFSPANKRRAGRRSRSGAITKNGRSVIKSMAKPAKQKADIEALKQRLVDGLQVVTGEGILSGSGHLSARIPGTETFLINPRFAGVLAAAEDICTVNFDGKRIAGAGPIPSESVIHSTVYRHRPDVLSVLHCHARYSILMGLQEGGLIP